MRTALAILLMCWAAATLAAPHPQNQASGEQANSSRAIADALGNIAATYNQQAEDARRSPERNPCEPGTDNRNSDLCAQWKAADAADRAAWWARFSGALSFIGLAGVALALFLTRQSNNIARDTAKRQLRAYVELVNEVQFNGLQPGIKPKPRLTARNNGQTPARNVVWVSSIGIFPLPLPDDAFPVGPAPEPSSIILGSHQPTFSSPELNHIPKVEEIAALAEGKGSLFVYGEITYTDVFGDNRHTRYRLAFNPAVGIFQHCAEGSEST